MLVGVLGLIGSGKGTVGEILKEIKFHQISFASGVKDVTSVMFDWPSCLLLLQSLLVQWLVQVQKQLHH